MTFLPLIAYLLCLMPVCHVMSCRVVSYQLCKKRLHLPPPASEEAEGEGQEDQEEIAENGKTFVHRFRPFVKSVL